MAQRKKQNGFDDPPEEDPDETYQPLDLTPRKKPEIDPEQWPTIVETSQQTGIAISTLRRWASEGKIMALVVGRAYRVNPLEAVRLQAAEDRRNMIASPDPEATREALERSRETGSPDAPTTAMQVQSPAAMQPQHSPQAMQFMLPPGLTGMMTAVTEVAQQSNTRLGAADRHVEALVSALLSSTPKLQQAFSAQLESVLEHNRSLQEENKSLRADLREWHESQRTDRIKEKELEIKKTQVEGAIDFGKTMAPPILAFIGAKMDPSDPTRSDAAIASVLTKITQEQATKLHEQGLVTPEQAFQAVQFRQTPPKPGELTRWMKSFSGEAIAKIVAADVLPKDLTIAFVAAHEAAGKVQVKEATPTPTPAPTPAGVPEGGRILDAEQNNTIKEFIGAFFMCSEVITDEKDPDDGARLSVLQLIGSKMSPRARAGIKSL